MVEIVAEILGVGVSSKKVTALYFELLRALGPEFSILKDLPVSDIARVDARVAEAIRRMREGQVIIRPGYDGEFGVIKLFKEGELATREGQGMMF